MGNDNSGDRNGPAHPLVDIGNDVSMKKLIKKFLLRLDLFRTLSHVTARSVVILRYHSVQDNPETFAHTIGSTIIHSTDVFREHMRLLAKHYHPVSMDEVTAFLAGRLELPRSAVAVTFDDGYKDNYEIAAPILKEHGIPATFYVIVGSIESSNMPWFVRVRSAFGMTKKAEWRDREGAVYDLMKPSEKLQARRKATAYCACATNGLQSERVAEIEKNLDVQDQLQNADLMLTWNEIRALKKDGHIIGSHTMSHPNLAYLDQADMKRELSDSKEILERELGVEISHFAYPNPILEPIWNESSYATAKEVGYRTVVTCDRGRAKQDDDPGCLRRIVVPNDKNELKWYIDNTLAGRVM
jgi:peptidoglycan/xylan/chitin deacetylase (PgdA/CDA1 family)